MLERFSRREILELLVLGMIGLALPDSTRKTEKPNQATVIPTDTAQKILEVPVEEPKDPFETLIKPFLEEARVRRLERAQSDPEYTHRIDLELNQNRLNFLLFGYGETHEPPFTERAFIGSITIFSCNTQTRQVDLVSLTHDIRAPELENFQRVRGKHNETAIKIDKAYSLGGFDLLRLVIENATGFSADFQIAFQDVALANFVDDVFDGVEVEVPADFEVDPFYLEGKKYEKGQFKKGRQKMPGLKAIQFIKTVPVRNPSRELEHNRRKHLVFEGILKSLKENTTNPLFWARTLFFINRELGKKTVEQDFDSKTLLGNNLGTMISGVGKIILRSDGTIMPKIDRTLYVVDSASGDGGVWWVNADGKENPVTKRDLESGVYPDRAMEIPPRGNPYALDLVTEYWQPVRTLIKKRLLG